MSEGRTVFVGVDTGGTYTDAVVYDDAAGAVIAKAKAPTTPDDLAIGIGSALDRVLQTAAVDGAAIGLVSLSTTLATNALVEGVGRPACLVMIGFEAEAVTRGGLAEAIGSDTVISIAGGHTPHGGAQADLDLAALRSALAELSDEVEGFAVTGQFGVRNPEHEIAARDLIRETTGLPVTCSHELCDGLNGPKRSVTALLNARLIAMIEELVSTTAEILTERSIDAPIMVVRGNGSLVSSDFVRDRPVETILSGPAASLIGAAHLAAADDAIISDIGGTTTDIAVLRGGLPEFGAQGATVGGHQTMVEAVLMHTHGLGGDSEIGLVDRAVGAQLLVGPRRVVPIVVAAETDAAAIEQAIIRQRNAETPPSEWSGMFVRATTRVDGANLDRNEVAVLEGIGDGLTAVDVVVGTSLQTRALRRLVTRGLIRMCGFTPTDASHVLGTQDTHEPELAIAAADLFAQRRDRYGNPIAGSATELAEAVVEALTRRSAEALLEAALIRDGLSGDTVRSELVDAALDRTAETARADIGLAVPLVGLGAPAANYYPAIAELLGTDIVVPEHADVANAIGAVVGKVRIRRQVTVTAPRRGIFRVHAGGDPETCYEKDDAQARAFEVATATVRSEMVDAGAAECELETFWSERSADVEGREMFVEGTATVIGSGRPKLD
ncbi:MAG: hydantoinase/oxoprolinase family protein [Acidimicrobiales bacterium]|jgi:N-methylhydantoinase A/oxoprolinase/acetone carboxylase beta subunit|nr:hydantoinase/oxoprolinase family protein [Acidimicrobiales bacterium]